MPGKPLAMLSAMALVDDEEHIPSPAPVLRRSSTELHVALPHPLPCARRVQVSFMHDGAMISGQARVRFSVPGRTVLVLAGEEAPATYTRESLLTDMPRGLHLHEC